VKELAQALKEGLKKLEVAEEKAGKKSEARAEGDGTGLYAEEAEV
jgi:hypothetical protein